MNVEDIAVADGIESAGDDRRAAIHTAAIAQFSERGFAGTSMANIAEAAGMSRPALYQYFRNKGDIFSSAFIALFDEHADAALLALKGPGTTADQLDGLLQRFEGDLWEAMSASPHSDEIMSAKNAHLTTAIRAVVERVWDGVAAHLKHLSPGQSAAARARRAGWADVLHFSPKGFKQDQPSVDTYRSRLTALARSIAADIDSSQHNS